MCVYIEIPPSCFVGLFVVLLACNTGLGRIRGQVVKGGILLLLFYCPVLLIYEVTSLWLMAANTPFTPSPNARKGGTGGL